MQEIPRDKYYGMAISMNSMEVFRIEILDQMWIDSKENILGDLKRCPNKTKLELNITSTFIFECEILIKAFPKGLIEMLVDIDVTPSNLIPAPAEYGRRL